MVKAELSVFIEEYADALVATAQTGKDEERRELAYICSKVENRNNKEHEKLVKMFKDLVEQLIRTELKSVTDDMSKIEGCLVEASVERAEKSVH